MAKFYRRILVTNISRDDDGGGQVITRPRLPRTKGHQLASPICETEYQSFMAGYVRRINEATLKVDIGGVRIGSAKFSRLAQINLKSRVITFSRFAIANVPERGRRYLVIHELSHVIEPSHNKAFWSIVQLYEPDYRRIGRQLDLAFRENVTLELARQPGKQLTPRRPSSQDQSPIYSFECLKEDFVEDGYSLDDDDSGNWRPYEPGIMYGGSF